MTIDILKTLQYLKPDIKVLVWNNDIDKIQYNENEDFRPSKETILAVNQDNVKDYFDNLEAIQKVTSIQNLQNQLNKISAQLQQIQGV